MSSRGMSSRGIGETAVRTMALSVDARGSTGAWKGTGGGRDESGTTGAKAATVTMHCAARNASNESVLRRLLLGVKHPFFRGRHTDASVSVRQIYTTAQPPSCQIFLSVFMIAASS